MFYDADRRVAHSHHCVSQHGALSHDAGPRDAFLRHDAGPLDAFLRHDAGPLDAGRRGVVPHDVRLRGDDQKMDGESHRNRGKRKARSNNVDRDKTILLEVYLER